MEKKNDGDSPLPPPPPLQPPGRKVDAVQPKPTFDSKATVTATSALQADASVKTPDSIVKDSTDSVAKSDTNEGKEGKASTDSAAKELVAGKISDTSVVTVKAGTTSSETTALSSEKSKAVKNPEGTLSFDSADATNSEVSTSKTPEKDKVENSATSISSSLPSIPAGNQPTENQPTTLLLNKQLGENSGTVEKINASIDAPVESKVSGSGMKESAQVLNKIIDSVSEKAEVIGKSVAPDSENAKYGLKETQPKAPDVNNSEFSQKVILKVPQMLESKQDVADKVKDTNEKPRADQLEEAASVPAPPNVSVDFENEPHKEKDSGVSVSKISDAKLPKELEQKHHSISSTQNQKEKGTEALDSSRNNQGVSSSIEAIETEKDPMAKAESGNEKEKLSNEQNLPLPLPVGGSDKQSENEDSVKMTPTNTVQIKNAPVVSNSEEAVEATNDASVAQQSIVTESKLDPVSASEDQLKQKLTESNEIGGVFKGLADRDPSTLEEEKEKTEQKTSAETKSEEVPLTSDGAKIPNAALDTTQVLATSDSNVISSSDLAPPGEPSPNNEKSVEITGKRKIEANPKEDAEGSRSLKVSKSEKTDASENEATTSTPLPPPPPLMPVVKVKPVDVIANRKRERELDEHRRHKESEGRKSAKVHSAQASAEGTLKEKVNNGETVDIGGDKSSADTPRSTNDLDQVSVLAESERDKKKTSSKMKEEVLVPEKTTDVKGEKSNSKTVTTKAEDVREHSLKTSNAPVKTSAKLEKEKMSAPSKSTKDAKRQNGTASEKVDVRLETSRKRLRLKSEEVIKSSTIKKIMKIDKDVKMTATEAVFLVSKATECFLGKMMTQVHKQSLKGDKKGSINYNDVAKIVKNNPDLEFLVDLLPEV